MLDKEDRKPMGNRQRYSDLDEAQLKQLQEEGACVDEEDDEDDDDSWNDDEGEKEDEPVGHLAEEIANSGESVGLPPEDGDVEIVDDDCMSPNEGGRC